MARPLVSLIAVNFNGRDHLGPFLESVRAQDYLDLEVWVVDNGSRDGSVEWLRAQHPYVRVLENPENLGFATPNNQAARLATGTYLALLNNDMRLSPDWVSRMVARMEAAPPDLACLGSRILNWDGTRVDFIGGTIAFNGMGRQPAFQLAVDSPEGTAFPDELPFACGGAMLIRRDTFLEVGGFDEDYFAYFEDVDLGWRLWVLGYRVGFCPEAVVYHRHNGTSGRFDPRKKLALLERNALATMIKNYDDESLASALPAALLLAFKRVGVRAGLDRNAFRFRPVAPARGLPAAASPSAGGTGWGRIWRNLWRVGPRLTLKKVVLALAHGALARWEGLEEVSEAEVAVRREAYAVVAGVEDLVDMLPTLMAKRAKIQQARKRTDAEILRLSPDRFEPLLVEADYPDSHWSILRALGLDRRCERAEESQS